jgi:F420-non-reducing hydrogenase iron-sulfur subunit
MEASFVLEAFANGADGVLVLGCHIGDCHYRSGNVKAEVEMGKAFKLAEMAGIDGDRMRLEWVSASEARRFADVITEFTEKIGKMGPLPGGSRK